MRLHVLSVGKARDRPAAALAERYLERLGRQVTVEVGHVREASTRGGSREDVQRLEAAALREALGRRRGRGRLLTVALDERGRQPNTREFAATLRADAESGVQVLSFVLGGAEGLDPAFVAEADRVISLSRLTLPHELARALLAEQLYRAWSLLSGHPYHRD